MWFFGFELCATEDCVKPYRYTLISGLVFNLYFRVAKSSGKCIRLDCLAIPYYSKQHILQLSEYTIVDQLLEEKGDLAWLSTLIGVCA